jgi:hypothetical protein
MKTIRLFSVSMLALVLVFAPLAPASARAQSGKLFSGRVHTFVCPADTNHEVRTTISAPDSQFQADARAAVPSFYLRLHGVDGDVTHVIEPGASFTFTIDPRSAGHVVDERSGLRHVRVEFYLEVEVIDRQPTPQAAITIELVNKRTREVVSFQAYEGGYVGTVQFGSSDPN